jgi:protein O-GlcNAc transferase
LKYRNYYQSAVLRRRVLDALAACGVDPRRIDFRSADEDAAAHLAHYRDVDAALDSLPFCGSTTTFEALSMGVPVVTLPGETMVGRWSASMLKALRLEEWIARDAADFAAICRRLADDPHGLATLRATLPGRVARSSLCDGERKTRCLERLFRAVWRRRCRFGATAPR